MTEQVLVVAAGMVPFTKRAPGTVDLLAARAIRRVLDGASVDRRVIEETYVGSAKGGSLIGQRALRFTGLGHGMPVYNVENACTSSAVAFHMAYRAIAAGQTDCALVVGVDQLSSLGKGALPVQATEWEGLNLVTNPAIYAMRAQRYLWETGGTVKDLARVVVKSRSFASRNENAQLRGTSTVGEVLSARSIADPLTLLQCSPKSDGAAAVIIMSRRRAETLGLSGPVVRASVVVSGEFSLASRDITKPDITARAANLAFATAGMGPDDLDVVELHDAFSIAELLYTEELGLCEPGEGAEFLRSGASASLDAGAAAVVNPSGGLLSRGHPIGATGIAQLVELTMQLNGWAGERQREAARIGMAHVTGGGASGFDNGACCVTVLSAD